MASRQNEARPQRDESGYPIGYDEDGTPFYVCRVYWGSHGCDRPRGHAGPHLCIACWSEDESGWVGAPPYYGPDTCFYGEDAEALGLPLVKDRRSDG